MRLSLRLLLSLVLLFGYTSPLFSASEKNSFPVEGIVYDDSNNHHSVAVVNGELLQKGDVYGDYRIIDIQPDSVQVIDQKTGREKSVGITGGKSPGVFSQLKTVLTGDQKSLPRSPAKTSSQNNLLSQVMSSIGQLTGNSGTSGPSAKIRSLPNPFMAALGLAWEIQAIMELRAFYVAAMAYYLDEGRQAKNFDELVNKKLLSKELQSGVHGKYRYALSSSAEGPAVHAGPIDTESGLKYYFIDEEGTIRVEKDRPPSARSPAMNPANVMGWFK